MDMQQWLMDHFFRIDFYPDNYFRQFDSLNFFQDFDARVV